MVDEAMTSPPKIYVAGHQGMVGSAIVRVLQGQGTGLRAGIEQAYADFLATFSSGTADVFDSRVLRP